MPTVQDHAVPKSDRPKRDDKAVKIDRHLAAKAKMIAEMRGIPVAEYLSDLLGPLIKRDWPGALKKLDSSRPRGEDE